MTALSHFLRIRKKAQEEEEEKKRKEEEEKAQSNSIDIDTAIRKLHDLKTMFRLFDKATYYLTRADGSKFVRRRDMMKCLKAMHRKGCFDKVGPCAFVTWFLRVRLRFRPTG